MTGRGLLVLVVAGLVSGLLAGCGGGGGGGDASGSVKLTGVIVDPAAATDKNFMGDLWPATWASDDKLYMAFGDGTGMNNCVPSMDLNIGVPSPVPGVVVHWDDTAIGGSATQASCPAGEWIPGMTKPAGAGFYDDFCDYNDCSQCYALCPFTPNGLVAMSGSPPVFQSCTGADQCVVKRNIPTMVSDALSTWVKTSSLIAIGNRLIVAAHYKAGTPTDGYLAYIDNFQFNQDWTRAAGASPWTGASHFRVLVFIQMGKAYADNTDGYLYAFGMDSELDDPVVMRMDVYLARVPKDQAMDYSAWQYYRGISGPPGDPCYDGVWSCMQSDAAAIPGLYTYAQASAMYHTGLGKYLFFSGYAEAGPDAALFAADNPWGPWQQVGTFSGGFIGALIPKGAGSNTVYITGAGGGGFPYTLNTVQMTIQTSNP